MRGTALAGLAALGACHLADPPPAPPPDLLLVVLDTVRHDATHGLGRPGVTPQLDALAAQGARFSDVTTHGSWTWPSHASLFTGAPPWEHGARFAPPSEAALVLGERQWSVGAFPTHLPTLAEQLSAAGYRTVSLSENPLIGPDLGSTRGFEQAEVRPPDSGMAWVLDRAQALLEEPDDRPLFLFVNVLDAHHPWLVSPVGWLAPHAATLTPATSPAWLRPFIGPDGSEVVVDLLQPLTPGGPSGEVAFHTGTWSPPAAAGPLFRDLYDASVHRSDYKLHRLLQSWSATDHTGAVAVTSDHGELLGERGLLFHGRTVWPELTRVPLVLVAPGRVPPGTVVDTPIQMTDLHDTLLDLAGVSSGPRTLLPVASATGPAPTGPIEAAAWADVGFGAKVGGALQHDWRLRREGDLAVVVGSDGTTLVFDTAADPQLTTDLSATDRRTEAQPLIDAVAAWRVRPISRSAGASAQTVEALQALGYMDRTATPEPAPEPVPAAPTTPP